MAKKNQEETIVDVQQVYTKSEMFIDRHRKSLAIGVGAIALILIAVLAYRYLIVKPQEDEAAKQSWKAEQYFEMDSLDLALYGDGLYPGLENIVEDYSGTKAASRAHFSMGTIFRDRAEYDLALEHFRQVDAGDDVVGTLALGNVGDIQIELGETQKGAETLERAARKGSKSLSAGFLAPMYFFKAGVAQLELGNKAKARDMFKEITENYPKSAQYSDAQKYHASLLDA
mgnify:CR=1 FL=1|jgi:tetratricopeptide (TPR) repeat protein